MSWLLPRLLIGLVRLLVGAPARWIGPPPAGRQRIYFANHSSHIDTLALWTALPSEARRHTRAVAAADYWQKDALRRRIATQGLNAVFINRHGGDGDPLQPLMTALAQGDSLIIFPEGTRRPQAVPGEFKSGLFHLAQRFPEVELVPVYLENLHRCLPKGSLFPVPLICTVRFGAPLPRVAGEAKADFLARSRAAILELL